MIRLFLSCLFLSLLSACGDLPEPFKGNPGFTARRLAVPADTRLVVPPPTDALLPNDAATAFVNLLAEALQKEDVPALAQPPRKYDWLLSVTAVRRDDKIVPHFAILDASGKDQGSVDTTPVPAAAWSAGWPATLGKTAGEAAPRVVALMTSIRAIRDRADPTSLLNRIAKLYVPEVTGASGDGNLTLTKLIRARLGELGPLVQLTPEDADFTVQGKVVLTPAGGGNQRVEVVWTVTRPSGVVSGKVSQLNLLPAGSLDHYWGDVAGAVTQEAAPGINTVVERFIGRLPEKPKP